MYFDLINFSYGLGGRSKSSRLAIFGVIISFASSKKVRFVIALYRTQSINSLTYIIFSIKIK